MSLIRVFTELDDGETVCLPAKIIETNGNKYSITYLSPTENRDNHQRKIYKYEYDTYEITSESITEYLNSDMEIDFGFKQISEDEFIKYESDSDDDYEPSSEDESDSESDEEDEKDEEDESIYDEDSD
jgi:hypothetical protein